jgi:MFS family permease
MDANELGFLIEEALLTLALIGVPVGVLLFFLISLVRYLRRDKSDEVQTKKRKRMLIISVVIFGIFLAVCCALFILLMIGLAHM